MRAIKAQTEIPRGKPAGHPRIPGTAAPAIPIPAQNAATPAAAVRPTAARPAAGTAARPAAGTAARPAAKAAPTRPLQMAEPASKPIPSAELLDELRGRLWSLSSPVPAADYVPPWRELARELSGKLASAITPGAYQEAAAGSRLGYAECVKKFQKTLPSVYRAMMDVRGLLVAAHPDKVPKNSPTNVAALPGSPLVYETLTLS